MDQFIPVNTPIFIGNEKKYLNECIDTGWVSCEGRFVSEFENQLAAYCNRKHGISVSSGTAALEIAIKSLGLCEGDEIIVPSLTIISCSNAIIKNGLVPVLVDSYEDTWNMSVEDIRAKITPKTKAIMMVHLYGLPCLVDEILNIAKEFNLKIIEDAAEMHGQTYRDQPCGGLGDISIFSFYANKHITTGEGGMILTNEDTIADKCRSLRNHCFMSGRRFRHDDIGQNARMTNLQAAVGLAQLETLPQFVERKRTMGNMYTKAFKDLKGVSLPIEQTDYAQNIYWAYGVVLDSEVFPEPEKVMKSLTDAGIGNRPFFWPLHKQPIYQDMGLFSRDSHPVAEKLANYGFYLPSGLSLTKDQINTVIEKFRDVISKHSENI